VQASHVCGASHVDDASHVCGASHVGDASHVSGASHVGDASHSLCTRLTYRKLGEF
jgi:hypothetical protein